MNEKKERKKGRGKKEEEGGGKKEVKSKEGERHEERQDIAKLTGSQVRYRRES